MMNYKVCTKCGNKFPATVEFFHKMKSGKLGLRATCKVCRQEYYQNNRERHTATMKKYYRNNKEKIMINKVEYRKNNKKKIAVAQKKNQENNKEKYSVTAKRWRKNNPEKIIARNAKRQAKKLNQTPNLTQDEKYQIELMYKKSHELGPDYQVDHIQSLSRGGLHHPNNLQIVTKSYNLQKRDKVDFRPPTTEELYIY